MKTQSYKAVGFVEALIAIAVAGISSIVLMSIAVRTTGQIVRNEIESELTEKAIEGGAMVRQIVANDSLQDDEEYFPNPATNINNCFALSGDSQTPSFNKTGENFDVVCRYDSIGRDQCLESVGEGEDMFRVFCIMQDSVPENGLVVGKVITGLSDCTTDDNKGKCKISDYEYYLGLKVE